MSSNVEADGRYQAFLDTLLDGILDKTGDVAYAERLSLTLLPVLAGIKPAYLDDDVNDMNQDILHLIKQLGLEYYVNNNVEKSVEHNVYPCRTIVYNPKSVLQLAEIPTLSVNDIIEAALVDVSQMGRLLGYTYPASRSDTGDTKFIKHVVNTGLSQNSQHIKIWTEACNRELDSATILQDIMPINIKLNNLFQQCGMSVESIVESQEVYIIKKECRKAYLQRMNSGVTGVKPTGVKLPKDPQSPLRTNCQREYCTPPKCSKKRQRSYTPDHMQAAKRLQFTNELVSPRSESPICAK